MMIETMKTMEPLESLENATITRFPNHRVNLGVLTLVGTVLRRFVKNKANDTLDTTQSYKKQKPADINAICALAKKHYPVVNKYDNYWPIRDMIKLHLKYTSGIYWKQGETFFKAVWNHGTLVN
ncbi:hypothetical protein BU17DRAFT_67381 [Hysterangium stoloniferum]|nr:hypothetical protein BU17DRAFT_67381 [Hysterangium stoloniferum]